MHCAVNTSHCFGSCRDVYVSQLLRFVYVHLSSPCFTGSKWHVAFGGFCWCVCEFGNDSHLLSLPATCSLLPMRAHPSDPSVRLWLCSTHCCGAILQSQQWVWWFRVVHLHKLVVLHLYAITLFSCTSLSLLYNWALLVLVVFETFLVSILPFPHAL